MICRSKHIIAIDPGTDESGYAILGPDLHPDVFGKTKNEFIRQIAADYIARGKVSPGRIVGCVEMVASYGMPVGKEVFETCVWIGRFIEQLNSLGIYGHQSVGLTMIYRRDEKLDLCDSPRANDATIRQALIDRFGPVGTKKAPGWFYGVHKDAWSAVAVGVTCYDLYLHDTKEQS